MAALAPGTPGGFYRKTRTPAAASPVIPKMVIAELTIASLLH